VPCATLKLFFKFTSYFGCTVLGLWWMLFERNVIRIAQVTSIVVLKLTTDRQFANI